MKKYTKQERKEIEFSKINFKELSNGFHKEIISLFENISKPFDNGSGLKEKAMLESLADYGAVYETGIGIVVPAIKEAKITVVSHMDLIPLFNKGFAKDRIYSLGLYEEKEIISGALDNTFTNAVVMHSIFELRSKNLAEDVAFVFTEEEETTSAGIRNYIKKYGKDTFFINLDVTNDGQECNMSIEYDEPNWHICKQINNKFNASFTIDRVGDDMDEIIKANANGFSYCIPTFKTIHSYKNYTYIENIVPYYQGLLWMLTELDLSNQKQNFKYISMKKALSIDDEKILLKKENKAKKKDNKRFTGGYWNKDGLSERAWDSHLQQSSIFFDEDDFDTSKSTSYVDYGSGNLFVKSELDELILDISISFDMVVKEFINQGKPIDNYIYFKNTFLLEVKECIENEMFFKSVHSTELIDSVIEYLVKENIFKKIADNEYGFLRDGELIFGKEVNSELLHFLKDAKFTINEIDTLLEVAEHNYELFFGEIGIMSLLDSEYEIRRRDKNELIVFLAERYLEETSFTVDDIVALINLDICYVESFIESLCFRDILYKEYGKSNFSFQTIF